MSHKTSRGYGMTYAEAGVNIDASNIMIEAIKPLAHTTRRPGASGEIGGFGGLFDLKAAGYSDPILVAASDGVGTKVKIAIETGQHETIGIDLVAMCVNDLIAQGAEPLFFLDYFATSKLDASQGARIVQGIADGCRQAGCALLGGETAEMPGLYKKGDYDLAGFAVGAVERGHLLPMIDIMPGDVIISLPSSGLHANGFSLVRHIVEHSGLDWHTAAPFATEKPLGTALLEPTRIYVRQLLEVIRKTGAIKGLAHITGGGMVDNIPRILPPGTAACIDLAFVPVPPVFSWLARVGKVEESEMLRTFNCGIGMIVVVSADEMTMVTNALIAEGETPTIIGQIIASTDRPQVVTTGQLPL